ncbi:MAG: hypothetical protein ABII07_01580 [Patescibacteria group bacterium]|nr:hypothetical protein [Patescibacteria group bacterium]
MPKQYLDEFQREARREIKQVEQAIERTLQALEEGCDDNLDQNLNVFRRTVFLSVQKAMKTISEAQDVGLTVRTTSSKEFWETEGYIGKESYEFPPTGDPRYSAQAAWTDEGAVFISIVLNAIDQVLT